MEFNLLRTRPTHMRQFAHVTAINCVRKLIIQSRLLKYFAFGCRNDSENHHVALKFVVRFCENVLIADCALSIRSRSIKSSIKSTNELFHSIFVVESHKVIALFFIQVSFRGRKRVCLRAVLPVECSGLEAPFPVGTGDAPVAKRPNKDSGKRDEDRLAPHTKPSGQKQRPAGTPAAATISTRTQFITAINFVSFPP